MKLKARGLLRGYSLDDEPRELQNGNMTENLRDQVPGIFLNMLGKSRGSLGNLSLITQSTTDGHWVGQSV